MVIYRGSVCGTSSTSVIEEEAPDTEEDTLGHMYDIWPKMVNWVKITDKITAKIMV